VVLGLVGVLAGATHVARNAVAAPAADERPPASLTAKSGRLVGDVSEDTHKHPTTDPIAVTAGHNGDDGRGVHVVQVDALEEVVDPVESTDAPTAPNVVRRPPNESELIPPLVCYWGTDPKTGAAVPVCE
jgi:hypothetical protein